MIGPEGHFVFIVLLGALMMVNALSIDMILPALPALGTALNATPDQVQLTLSLYLVGYAAGQFVVGPLTDRFGRRPVLVGGLSLYALATLACALSRRVELLVAARFIQGLAACGGPVVVRAIVRDHVSGARAAHMMSSLTTVFALGPMLAPLVGGALLVRWGWPSIFLFIMAWAATMAALAWAGLAESLKVPDRDALRWSRLAANYRAFFTTRVAFGFAFVNGLCWIGIFSFLSASPFVFIRFYGVAPDHYGYYFGMIAITIVGGAFTNKRLLRRMRGAAIMRYGFGSLVAGGLGTVIVPLTPIAGPFTLMLAVMLYMFGQALVQPNAVAYALEPLPHMAGMASALMGIVQMICGAIGCRQCLGICRSPMGVMMLVAALACSLLFSMLLAPRLKAAT